MSDLAAYEIDLYAWARYNAQLLHQGRLTEIDVENIAEELEALSRSEQREFLNRLAVLLTHLLKWTFQPELRSNSWRYTIEEQRREVAEILEESPSLAYHATERLIRAYDKARFSTSRQTGIARERFPRECPFTLEQTLDEAYWPET
ncbi:conserved hypothetical protein [Gammaproteobacteria bacterium]